MVGSVPVDNRLCSSSYGRSDILAKAPGGVTALWDPALLGKGLEATEPLWPDVRLAFGWVHRAAVVLANKKGLDATGVRRRYRGLIAAVAQRRASFGRLAEAFDHFRKVTRSYWASDSNGAKNNDLHRD